ncbi:MAG: type II secretion system protein [Chloroflexi bacterium]|nr:type II secretion system protein [Chloroflexota bacterium]MBI3931341.1 type II secretion system protein [Chloroflexota bacterium]
MKQKGFTLVEVLVVLAITGVILTGAVLSIYSVFLGTDRNNSQIVALTDIDRAVLVIKKDLMMAQETNLSSTPQSSANLTWIDYTTSFESSNQSNHSSSYILSGTELRRTYDGTLSIIGRNITSLDFTQSGRVVTVVITATGPGVRQRSETLTFSSLIRAEEIE